ncbi:MAG: hypothetical protein Q7R79_03885 [bacterium]|nr:hypothetical protein [bacterium]
MTSVVETVKTYLRPTQAVITSVYASEELVDLSDPGRGTWVYLFTDENQLSRLSVPSPRFPDPENLKGTIGDVVRVEWKESEAGTRYATVTEITLPEADK